MFKAGDELLFWKQGVSLDQAVFHFAPPEWMEKYRVLKQAKDAQLAEAANPLKGEATFVTVLERFVPFFIENPALREHLQNMRSEIFRGIFGGTLIAFGYSLPRHAADQPCIIPEDVWSGKVDWKESTVTGRGLHFESVRVTLRNMTVGIELEHVPQTETPLISSTVLILNNVDKTHTGDPGRPSPANLYLGEFERRSAKGNIEKSLAAQARVLQHWLKTTHPDIPTPTTGNIENRIRELYNKAKGLFKSR